MFGNICWPARFGAKWLALFAMALFVGTLIGVRMRLAMPRPVAPQIQANIIVLTQYAGEPAYQRTRAKVYFGRTRDDMREDQVIRIGTNEPGLRTQAAGVPIDFMVQPLDGDGNPEGTPEHQQVKWPEQKGAEVSLKIQRSYARPKR